MTWFEKIILKRIRRRYERQIKNDFDPRLSRKLDCLIYLLEEGRRDE
jgi:hypothetical protein